MMCGFRNAYECIKVFSETDMTEDLKRIDVPVLILHGEDDQVVPIEASAREAIKLVKEGRLKTFPGGPHALPNVMAEEVNEELWRFLQE